MELGPRVLVADDDPDLRPAMVAALEDSGASVVSVATGAELIQRIADDAHFDLLVVDVSMPWMSGLQAALAARHAGLSMPIIVVSAGRDPGLPARVAALGGQVYFLRKPFELDELQRAARSFLGPR